MAPKFAGLDQSWFPLRSMWYTLPVAWWFTAAVIDPTKSVNTGHTIVVTPPLTANAARVAAHLESISAEFARDRESDLQAVALTVARKLVRRELDASPELLGSLVTKAIELLPLDHTLDVHLHPDDLRTLGSNTESLLPAGRSVRVQWIADAAVDKGGFLVESPARIVDGRTDTALRALYERFDHE